jgi:hypothetical protein
MTSADRDILASVLTSETGHPFVRGAIALTVLHRYRGSPAAFLRPGTHQGGRQQWATAQPGDARAYAIVDAMYELYLSGMNFHGARAAFEWRVQEVMHRKEPARFKPPEEIHRSWTMRGEILVAITNGWLFYK